MPTFPPAPPPEPFRAIVNRTEPSYQVTVTSRSYGTNPDVYAMRDFIAACDAAGIPDEARVHILDREVFQVRHTFPVGPMVVSVDPDAPEGDEDVTA